MIVLCDRVVSERSGKLLRHEMEGNVAEAARYREWEKVRRLVELGGNVNCVDEFRHTALHYAIMHGNSDICSFLLSRRANVNQKDKKRNTPLHLAANRPDGVDICQLLVDHKADVTSVNKKRQTPLHKAVGMPTYWPEAMLRPLITNESVNVADRRGNRALHLAVGNVNIQTVQLLVDCGADVNALNEDGQTPLHTAAGGEKDCPELCSILLKHNAKIDAVDKDGNQPLHLAWKRGHTRTSRLLLSNGADVNALNENGQTPLHTAAGGKKDCPELCSILVEYNAKIDAVDKDGNQPLHLACSRLHSETCSLLVSHGASTTSLNKQQKQPVVLANESVMMNFKVEKSNHALHIASRIGDTRTVQLLVDCGADVNVLNEDGQTPLHTAAGGLLGRPELCSILLKRNAKIDAVDKDGNQPLHLACDAAVMSTVQHLLDCNADVFATNNCHQTALHKAACSKRDRPEVCVMLIAKGAQVNATDGNGDTSLHVAFQKRKMKTVDVLVENDADCNVVNVCGETLLHLACKSRVERVELCDKLISHGVNPHIADSEGNLPLHVALKNRLTKTFGCLLQKSGKAKLDDLQKVTIDKEDLVAIFSRSHKVNDINTCGDIIKFSAKLDPSNRLSLRALNCHTTIGYLLIQRAVKEKNITFCQHLIDHGASVNADVPHSYRDHTFKDPPLHLAVKVGHTDLCRLLIEHGATIDPEMRGSIGALHLAVVNEQKDIARLLLSHGADLSKVEISGESALKRSEKQGNVKMVSIIQATGE